ncbi:MAG: hypothetical protein NZ534_02555 [Bacteroidia bacterium]|nr:hypothetical protein [Bacteroidia bacterium]
MNGDFDLENEPSSPVHRNGTADNPLSLSEGTKIEKQHSGDTNPPMSSPATRPQPPAEKKSEDIDEPEPDSELPPSTPEINQEIVESFREFSGYNRPEEDEKAKKEPKEAPEGEANRELAELLRRLREIFDGFFEQGRPQNFALSGLTTTLMSRLLLTTKESREQVGTTLERYLPYAEKELSEAEKALRDVMNLHRGRTAATEQDPVLKDYLNQLERMAKLLKDLDKVLVQAEKKAKSKQEKPEKPYSGISTYGFHAKAGVDDESKEGNKFHKNQEIPSWETSKAENFDGSFSEVKNDNRHTAYVHKREEENLSTLLLASPEDIFMATDLERRVVEGQITDSTIEAVPVKQNVHSSKKVIIDFARKILEYARKNRAKISQLGISDMVAAVALRAVDLEKTIPEERLEEFYYRFGMIMLQAAEFAKSIIPFVDLLEEAKQDNGYEPPMLFFTVKALNEKGEEVEIKYKIFGNADHMVLKSDDGVFSYLYSPNTVERMRFFRLAHLVETAGEGKVKVKIKGLNHTGNYQPQDPKGDGYLNHTVPIDTLNVPGDTLEQKLEFALAALLKAIDDGYISAWVVSPRTIRRFSHTRKRLETLGDTARNVNSKGTYLSLGTETLTPDGIQKSRVQQHKALPIEGKGKEAAFEALWWGLHAHCGMELSEETIENENVKKRVKGLKKRFGSEMIFEIIHNSLLGLFDTNFVANILSKKLKFKNGKYLNRVAGSFAVKTSKGEIVVEYHECFTFETKRLRGSKVLGYSGREKKKGRTFYIMTVKETAPDGTVSRRPLTMEEMEAFRSQVASVGKKHYAPLLNYLEEAIRAVKYGGYASVKEYEKDVFMKNITIFPNTVKAKETMIVFFCVFHREGFWFYDHESQQIEEGQKAFGFSHADIKHTNFEENKIHLLATLLVGCASYGSHTLIPRPDGTFSWVYTNIPRMEVEVDLPEYSDTGSLTADFNKLKEDMERPVGEKEKAKRTGKVIEVTIEGVFPKNQGELWELADKQEFYGDVYEYLRRQIEDALTDLYVGGPDGKEFSLEDFLHLMGESFRNGVEFNDEVLIYAGESLDRFDFEALWKAIKDSDEYSDEPIANIPTIKNFFEKMAFIRDPNTPLLRINAETVTRYVMEIRGMRMKPGQTEGEYKKMIASTVISERRNITASITQALAPIGAQFSYHWLTNKKKIHSSDARDEPWPFYPSKDQIMDGIDWFRRMNPFLFC